MRLQTVTLTARLLFRRHMGLLSVGTPLSWEETKKYADHVKEHGIIQFINLYGRLKDRHRDILKWGDEVSVISVFCLDCGFQK